MRYGFGVDIGGTTVKIAFFDEQGKMLDKWQITTNTSNGGSAILPDTAKSIRDYLQKNQIEDDHIIGVGVGVPGPVDEQGIVNRCVNLGWGVVDLHGELARLTGFPVKGGNDANVAALGECWKGSGAGSRSMVMATLGTGIGGGIVLDGKIIGGAHGAGGEIGHMVLNPTESEICGCGKRGCAEQYCSATGVVRLANRYLDAHDDESVLRRKRVIHCKDVFDAAKKGDIASMKILDQMFDLLGMFLANVCCTMDPEVIVLGGGVSKAGQMLVDGATQAFARYAFHACRGTRIVLASLGNDAGAYGAFKLALDAFA